MPTAGHFHVAIRVDASVEIGVGHLMRCLALANALKTRGATVRFLSRDLASELRSTLTAAGHEVSELPSHPVSMSASGPPHAAWLRCDWEEDAHDTLSALRDHARWDWLIVDHYALDRGWEERVRSAVRSLLVIDDLADRPHACDVLVDQNLHENARPYRGLVPDSSLTLIGPRFALLRPEFSEARQTSLRVRGAIDRLLIFFGGADPSNLTERALDAVIPLSKPVDVVIGGLNPQRERIVERCRPLPHVTCHVQTNRIATLMTSADLAIGAAGTASLERCCVGLPAVAVSLADNQVAVARMLAAANVLVHIEPLSLFTQERIRSLVAELDANPERVAELSRNAAHLVDGHGADRVCAVLLVRSGVSLRPATPNDAEPAWHWRNHPATREQSFDSSPVPLETHLAWWQRTLASSDRTLFVASAGELPFGIVRLDKQENDGATVSVYLDPRLVGLGLGKALLSQLARWADAQSHLRWLEAFIKPENLASRRAFLAAGFKEEGTRYLWTRNDPGARS